jgi:hypothetical protein
VREGEVRRRETGEGKKQKRDRRKKEGREGGKDVT